MKKLTLLLITFISSVLTAQEENIYKHNLEGVKTVQINNAKVYVKQSNNSYLTLKNKIKKQDKSENRINPKKIELRKGLKAIYAKGEDNTNLGFSVKKEDTKLIISNLKSHYKSPPVELSIPKDINIIVINKTPYYKVYINDISSEIEVKNSGGTNINNVTGPLTINSSFGDVKIVFSKLSQKSPTSIITSSGNIDITMPKKAKTSLQINGSFFTNFDIAQKNINNDKVIEGTTNGGGVKVKLNSTFGEIYLRQKNN